MPYIALDDIMPSGRTFSSNWPIIKYILASAHVYSNEIIIIALETCMYTCLKLFPHKTWLNLNCLLDYDTDML